MISLTYPLRTALTYSFSYLGPVCCSMSSSNCCFLICIQISQEAGQGVWYSHLFQNFPRVVLIYTVKAFGVANKAEVDIFLEFSWFLMIQQMLAIWFLVLLPLLNPAWTSGSSQFMYYWKAWQIIHNMDSPNSWLSLSLLHILHYFLTVSLS